MLPVGPPRCAVFLSSIWSLYTANRVLCCLIVRPPRRAVSSSSGGLKNTNRVLYDLIARQYAPSRHPDGSLITEHQPCVLCDMPAPFPPPFFRFSFPPFLSLSAPDGCFEPRAATAAAGCRDVFHGGQQVRSRPAAGADDTTLIFIFIFIP